MNKIKDRLGIRTDEDFYYAGCGIFILLIGCMLTLTFIAVCFKIIRWCMS